MLQEKKKSRRYIPKTLTINRDELSKFGSHIRVVSNEIEVLIIVSPLCSTSLNELSRGRTSRKTIKKRSPFANSLSELSPQTRQVLKKRNVKTGIVEVNVLMMTQHEIIIENPYSKTF